MAATIAGVFQRFEEISAVSLYPRHGQNPFKEHIQGLAMQTWLKSLISDYC